MAIKMGMSPTHPGGFVRRSIIPDEMSVTDAAGILGIGRPALSNLLNENSSLSPEMALRIEKAFGVNMDTLLRMQVRYDAYKIRLRENEISVSRYSAV